MLMEGDMSRQEAGETADSMLILGALTPPYPTAESTARLVGRLVPRVAAKRRVATSRSPWRAVALCGFAAIAIFATAFAASPALRATMTRWFVANSVLYVTDISFVDGRHGWLLGVANTQAVCPRTTRCGLELRATNNGGRTWYPMHPPTAYGSYSVYFGTVHDGWIFGKGLWSTHDGGRTWRRITDRYTQDVQSKAGTVWALESPCQPDIPCHLSLARSTIGRDSWHTVETIPETASLIQPHLTVFSKISADLLTAGNLFETSDTGVTWQRRSAPCGSHAAGVVGLPFQQSLATRNGSDLFVMCSGMPGAGEQPKTLFASQDGGRDWRQVSSARGYKYDLHHHGSLPENGYVGQFSEAKSGRLWLSLERGALLTSTDGGRMWRQVLSYPQPDTNGGGLTSMAFVGNLQAWAVGDPRTVFHTTDGGRHWIHVRVQ
jgi:photosystem II stability/assembly factor-like uncharacterized protein